MRKTVHEQVSGLPPSTAAVGVGLMALAAVPAMNLEGTRQLHTLAASHAILLAVTLAGLWITAVRQLITVNADIETTRVELVELAVAAE